MYEKNGEKYFVVDGHHRVSVAVAKRQRKIDANVTQVLTAVPPNGRQGPIGEPE